MTTQASQALPGWSELLFRSMAKLRELFDSALDCLDPDTTDDFSHLFEGGRRLEKMLGEPESKDSNHDLMNVLAAIRGYAEMLREDLGTEQANMDEALSHLLEAVHAANETNTVAPPEPDPGEPRLITSEPGFILAVDDLQENRELVARYLSRSGHIVVTAESGEQALQTLEQTDVDGPGCGRGLGRRGRRMQSRGDGHPERNGSVRGDTVSSGTGHDVATGLAPRSNAVASGLGYA